MYSYMYSYGHAKLEPLEMEPWNRYCNNSSKWLFFITQLGITGLYHGTYFKNIDK